MSKLPSGWKETILDKAFKIYSGKSRPENKGCIPVYGGNGILEYTDDSNQDGNSIIIGRVGAYCGNVFFEENKFWLSDNALGVKNNDISDIKYLYYKLISMKLNNHAIGGAQPLLTQTILKQIEIILPPLLEQKAIASVLSPLDEKIELLQEQNITLQELAQTIYREWFVKFNYPDATGEMVNSDIGKIPRGWKYCGISELVDHIKESENPSRYPENEFYSYSLPSFDEGKKPELLLGKDINSNKYKVKNKSFLVSKLNPSTPRVWSILSASHNSVCSTEFQVIRPKLFDYYGFVFGALTSYQFREKLAIKAHGTSSSHQRVKPKDILDTRIILPDINNIKKFSYIVNEFLKKIDNNLLEIDILAKMKSTLLPKLMSGELRVKGFGD